VSASLPDLLALAARGPVHFVGVGGAGMSALAEALLRGGAAVSGCDNAPGEVTEHLTSLGATIQRGHDPAHVHGAAAVVRTAAVPADHPEIAAAHAQGIPVLRRAEALGALVNRATLLAVAGTHGKTTTTAMTTAILVEAGLDPTAFVGGKVTGWGSGLRAGGDRLYVAEADEYDRAFLTLRPNAAAVTSLEADHMEIYGSVEVLHDGFRSFLSHVPGNGLVAACVDDAGVRALLAGGVEAPIVAYGTAENATLRVVELEPAGRTTRFRLLEDGTDLGAFEVGCPGRHNVLNAVAALALARWAGADLEAARRALTHFQGVGRRFQELGTAAGVTLVDDYAHHPTEVRATLGAARAAYPDRRLVAAFQPHLYTRTRDHHQDFGTALALADVIFVADVFPAREAPIEGVDGALVAHAVEAGGAERVRYTPTLAQLENALFAELRPEDVCVLMGAGNIDQASRRLLARLSSSGAGA